MHHSTVIAKYLIDKGKKENKYFTQMQILKIVYLCNSAMLYKRDAPLIYDRIEAWQYGPVIPELYYEICHYGRNYVKEIEVKDENNSNITDENEIRIINKIYEELKAYSGPRLSTYTHQKGTPWDVVYKKAGNRAIIDIDIIKACCKNLEKIV